MQNRINRSFLIVAGALSLSGGVTSVAHAAEASATDPDRVDAALSLIVEEHRLATLGAAIIDDGEIVWIGHYGEQSPGVPASRDTMFNVASVTKTVTAELIIALADEGVISLDEPMATHWVDPDVADDPTHELLTPRHALTHSTGFPNWRYVDPEFKLRFSAEPGTTFSYSGEGFDYVARFVEEKTGTRFSDLVAEYVFEPRGLSGISMSVEDWVLQRLVLPVDEDGKRHRPFCASADERYCLEIGEWFSADDMATTVEDYARFMISVMRGERVSGQSQTDRMTIQTSTEGDPILACRPEVMSRCPNAQGFGLGWEIFEFNDAHIVSHGGSDWSERAMVYFDRDKMNGIVLFINGPSSTTHEALIDGMNTLDPGSAIAMLYRGWIDAYNASQD